MHKSKWVYFIVFLLISMINQPFTNEFEDLIHKSSNNSSTKNTISWNGIINLDTDYTVSGNDILTIQSCTEINLEQGVRLIIEGRLIVEGTESCPVIMDNQGTGDHMGIAFESISKNKASKVENLTIRNSDYGITIFSSNPEFRNLVIENSDKVGIDIYNGATPQFENVFIEGGGKDEHGGGNTNWRYGIGISIGNLSTPIFNNVYINGTLTRGFNFWGNSGGLYSNIEINNVTGSTLAAATCIWIMDSIPLFEEIKLNLCDNGIWVRQFDDSIQTNAVIKNAIIENSRFYGVIVDKNDHTNYTNYVMATFENLEISGTGGLNSNGNEFQEGVAAIEVNVSGAIFENVNLYDNPVPGLIGYLVDDTLFVKDINVTNCGKNNVYGHDSGVYIYAAFDNGPPTLENVNVSNAPGSGIHIERGATNGKNWNLNNNSKYGLFVDHATVRTNWINTTHNNKSGAYIFDSSNILLENLTSSSNGDQGTNNKDGYGIVFHLSNNVESNKRNVTCINCSSINDAFGGVYIEDSIDLYLNNIFISEPRNNGYGIYANNNGLTQIGHLNIDGALVQLNRSGPIVEINGAAKINGLNVQGNQENGYGLFWDGSSANIESFLSDSLIQSEKCINFSNLNTKGDGLICNGEVTIMNSNINISKLEAIDIQNLIINIIDGNSLLHLHKPINIDLNLAFIEVGSKIEEAYDLEIWVKNQYQNRLPFASLDIQFSYYNNDVSIITDYLGNGKMPNYVVREWSTGFAGTVPSQNEEVDVSCTYDNTENNTGTTIFDDDLIIYCNLTLLNQAPLIIWSTPIENEIFPSKGVVEFNSTKSWDLENDPLSYSWISDIDGDLLQIQDCNYPGINTNKSLFIANNINSLNCLSDGVHKITLEVCDDENACSYENRTITLTNLPIVVNLEINPSADGDGVLRIPRSTVVELNISGTYDPEGENMEILLTDSFNQQNIPPNDEMKWLLSFVDSPEDEVTVTITFNDGVAGNLISKTINIILFNEKPIVDFEIRRINDFSSSKIILDGSSSFDPENDNLTVEWFSSIDGILNNGTGIEALNWEGWLSSGTHEIFLRVIDSKHQWEWVEKSVYLDVENSPPIAIISSIINPNSNNYLSSDLITFVTDGSGDWDSSCNSLNEEWKVEINWYCNSNLSNIRSDLLSISWYSNIDGSLTLNNENSPLGWQGRLSAGNHTITLEINDGYHESAFSSILIEVIPSAPVLILDSPDLENEFRSNQSILFDIRKSIDYDGNEFFWELKDDSGYLTSNSGIELSNINPKDIHYINLPNGINNLTLTLFDSSGMESKYNMTLHVLSSSPIPSITSPIAHFEGTSNTFTFEAGEKINLSAEQSFDSDNDITNYEWKIKTNSGSWESIKSGSDATNLDHYLSPGKYELKLIVSDNLGGIGEKIVNILVESSRPILEQLSVNPQKFVVNEKSELRISIKLIDEDNTTKNVTAKITLESQTWNITLSDNGMGGDAKENDGVWTAILTWTPNSEGFASIRVTAIDIDLRYDEEVIDIIIGEGEFSLIEMFGGGENIAIGGFLIALLISLGLAMFIRKRTLNSVDIEDYIESWDSLTNENENNEINLILDDDLDL